MPDQLESIGNNHAAFTKVAYLSVTDIDYVFEDLKSKRIQYNKIDFTTHDIAVIITLIIIIFLKTTYY